MREFAVFVPLNDDVLAAVITVPDAEPRGLAVLSTGVGAPRSHRFQLWAVLAERLAARDVASVRWEYRGMHDSTGEVIDVVLSETPVEEELAVARFAMRALGIDHVVGVGNCLGAQAALALAAGMSECAGAVCILPRIMAPGGFNLLLRRIFPRKILAYLRSKPTVRRILLRPVGRLNVRPRSAVRDPLPAALEHADVLFLFDEEHIEARTRPFAALQRVTGNLPVEHQARFEKRVLPGIGLDRLGSLAAQRTLLEALVVWIGERFADEAASVGQPTRSDSRTPVVRPTEARVGPIESSLGA